MHHAEIFNKTNNVYQQNNENYDYMTNDDRRLVQGCHKWVYRTKIRANIEIWYAFCTETHPF